MTYTFKSFQAILRDMIAKFLAETPINDINPASVVTTFLEAPAQEVAQTYFQQYQNIRSTNLDTAEGDEIDTYAAGISSDLERFSAQKAYSTIIVTDPSITKISTTIYSGTRGPVSGQTYIDVNDASDFTSTGSLIIDRENDAVETIGYDTITPSGAFYRITLTSALLNDHGSNASVILSQGGDRIIPINTVVYVPASDVSDKIQYITTESSTILDGDSESSSIKIEATIAGTDSNISAGSINSFENSPFSGAEVSNPYPISNGRNVELDDDYKDRIKLYIQSLSKGIIQALIYAVLGLSSDEDNKRIISAKLVQPTTLDDDPIVYLFVDDGAGLEPTTENVGVEELLNDSSSGRVFLQTNNFPIQKANLKTSTSQPFNLSGGETLTFEVGGQTETITFSASNFTLAGNASANEVAEAINDLSLIIEARTSDNSTKVVISPITNTNEALQVTGGTANSELDFDTNLVNTLDLYKFDGSELFKLTKDGQIAFIESTTGPFNLSGGETLTIIVDGKSANEQTITFDPSDFALPTSATADEVVARINLELSGATAETYNNRVKIYSNKGRSSDSKIQVTGGTANSELDFDTGEVVGSDKDFILNRYNGQIELINETADGEYYTAGSEMTRAFLISQNQEPFNLSDGDDIVFTIDGGTPQSIEFLSGEFSNIFLATAQEVSDVINTKGIGIHAEDYNGSILVRTNSYDSSYSSLSVDSYTGTASNLGFEITEKTSYAPHCAFVISAVPSGAYSLAEDDNLIVIIDSVPYNITTQIDGTVTTGDFAGTYDTFIADATSISQNFNQKFTEDTDMVDFKILWTTGDNTGTSSTVSSYNASTGQFTLSAGLTFTIDIGDQFLVIPRTAKNVVTMLNSTLTSSLSSVATIELANSGQSIQIASKTFGADSSVQIGGGTANDELDFPTTISLGKNGYGYFSGVIKEAQDVISGLDSDLTNYPGVQSAGIQTEVLTPVVKIAVISYTLEFEEGFVESFVIDKAKNLIVSYVNSLKVGEDLLINSIINIVKNIDGVKDINLILPTSDINASDREVIRTNIENVYVG